MRQALPGFQFPYVLGVIRLPEGVRLYAHVKTAAPEPLAPGVKLRLVPGVIRSDLRGPVIGYCFEPLKED